MGANHWQSKAKLGPSNAATWHTHPMTHRTKDVILPPALHFSETLKKAVYTSKKVLMNGIK